MEKNRLKGLEYFGAVLAGIPRLLRKDVLGPASSCTLESPSALHSDAFFRIILTTGGWSSGILEGFTLFCFNKVFTSDSGKSSTSTGTLTPLTMTKFFSLETPNGPLRTTANNLSSPTKTAS
jgi:hypothetical protein